MSISAFKIETVELEITVLNFETFLREVERLRHQVGVRIILLCLIQFALNLMVI